MLGGLRQEGGAADGAQVTALEVYRRFVDDPDVVIKAYDPDKMIVRPPPLSAAASGRRR